MGISSESLHFPYLMFGNFSLYDGKFTQTYGIFVHIDGKFTPTHGNFAPYYG